MRKRKHRQHNSYQDPTETEVMVRGSVGDDAELEMQRPSVVEVGEGQEKTMKRVMTHASMLVFLS